MSELLNKLREGSVRLGELVNQIRQESETHKNDDHVALIQYFNELRLANDTFNEAKKALSEIHDTLSRDYVPDAMRRANVKTCTVVGVGRVSISHRFSASMVDKEGAISWLRDHDLGGIVIETVNSSTLSAMAKRLIEDEGRELPEDLFKTSTLAYTSITKA